MIVGRGRRQGRGLFAFALALLMVAVPPAQAGSLQGEGPLTLERSLALAKEQSLSLAAARAQVEAAQAKVQQARAGFWPQIGLSAGYSQFSEEQMVSVSMIDTPRGSSPVLELADHLYSTQVRLQQPLYTGGRLTAAQRQAELGLTAAEKELERVGLDLELQVAEAYYAVLRSRGLERVAQKAQEQVAAHRRALEEMYRAGTAVEADLVRVRAQEAALRQNLLKAQHGRQVAEESLKLLVGLPPEAALELQDVPEVPEALRGYEEVLSTALERRPELVRARLGAAQAEAGLQMARSALYPNLTLMVDYSWQEKELRLENGSWTARLNLSWSLFDAGAGRSRLQEAEAMARQSELAVRQLEDATRLEVRQRWLAVQEAQEAIGVAELEVQRAREDLRLAEARFRAGMGTSVEVLDAQAALVQAEEKWVQARYDYHLAVARLKRTAGLPIEGGWS
ncbi:MAG: TolC family protein [Bacillota bacterium]|nr:TolC family protein [Bacillota bacterium]